jgi:hypothetical protein
MEADAKRTRGSSPQRSAEIRRTGTTRGRIEISCDIGHRGLSVPSSRRPLSGTLCARSCPSLDTIIEKRGVSTAPNAIGLHPFRE